MPKKLYRAEIAFSMEMMSQGWQQQHIAKALSVKPESLRGAISRAMIYGAKEKPVKPTTPKRIKHTNERAREILAAQSSSQNMSNKRPKNAISNASGSANSIPRVGGAVSHLAL